jgi:hypothetical protein
MLRNLAVGLASVFAVVACSTGGTTVTGPGATGDGGTTPTPGTDASSGSGNACGETDGTSGVALCGACTNTNCCTQILACQGNATCPTLQTCLLRCTLGDNSCIQACQNLYPAGVTTYSNLTSCASLMCVQACSTPPVGCSNVPLGTTGNCSTTPFPLVWSCPAGPPSPQCVASPTGTANLYCCLQ